MPDRTDARIRALIVELVEHAPEAPSFQEIEDRGITVDQPRRIRTLMVAAIAVAGLALLVGVNRPGFRGGSISWREDGAHGITEEVPTRAA